MRLCSGTTSTRGARLACLSAGFALLATPANAAGIDGAQLGLVWALPF